MPSTEQLPSLSDAYLANSRWLIEHLADVVALHPNLWVVVAGGRIVAADADLCVVTAAAARLTDPSDAVFHFVDDGSLIFSTAGAAQAC